MILLDTNVIIHVAKNPDDGVAVLMEPHKLAYSVIGRIEAFSKQVSSAEEQYIQSFLNNCYEQDLTEPVVLMTIQLRRSYNIKTPDAIIAATALVHGLELWTANTRDFTRIEGLTLYNPLAEGA